MTHSRTRRAAITAAAVVAAGLSAGLGTAAVPSAGAAETAAPSSAGSAVDGWDKDGEVPTFAEFEADTLQEDSGRYVVNGDESVGDRADLRAFYERMVAEPPSGGPSNGLIVNTTPYGDDLWSASTATNLSYCVSDSFGSSKATIVEAMAAGAALWENQTSGIDFVYVPSADASCRTSNSAVLFSVEPTSTTQYIARAFFPSTGDSQRNVLVNPSALVSSGSWTPANIMGHELGHTLGFRHEHTRPEAGTCFEDNNWRPLTPYDSVSIMHYPQCNGGATDLTFSSSDATGVRSVY